MEVILEVQADAAGRELSIDTLDSARSQGENPRKEQAFIRMGLGAGKGIPHTAGMRLWKCAR